MSKKGDNFFEEHIEKIILAVVGLVCIWLFLTRVLFSPNYVEYEGGRFSPGGIDDRILTSKQAAELEEKLSSKPEPKLYDPSFGDFNELLVSAISKVDVSVPWPLPIHNSSMDFNRGKYVIPEIGGVNEVTIEYVRAVVYEPTVEINEEVVYDKAVSEVNDIDFVTVEAKFDVKGLYERFDDNFAGSNVQEEQWRDPCLAKPVFADVQLQRQEALADGSWSDWEIVPRTRIDHRRKMFELIEDVAKLPPGGMKVRMVQFDDRVVRIDLLQPKAYRIASAREEWFPPSVHKKFRQHMREREMEERRKAKKEEEEEREKERDERSDLRRTRRPGAGSGFGTGGRSGRGISEGLVGTEGLYGGTDTTRRRTTRSGSSRRRSTDDGTDTGRRSRRRTAPGLGVYENYFPGIQGDRAIRRGPSMNDVYNEFYKILLTRRTLLEKMREPLVFWAHDDTVEPEKRYRYRIRLGVFNPIAGTNQFSEGYRGFKNKVVLWSEFSDITESVEIPGRLYFFARDIQNEAAKIVTVQVSRYVLGYWHSKDFAVEQGEVIGKVVESETTTGSSRRRETAPEFFGRYPAVYGGYGGEELRIMGIESDIRSGIRSDIMGRTVPETIDYTTGAVLVDVVPVNDYDWSGGKKLNPRHYFDMLYTFDGMNIERMPIRRKYWARELKIRFNEIKKSEKEPREPFRDWGSRIAGSAPVISMPGSEEDGYYNRDLPFRPAPRRR